MMSFQSEEPSGRFTLDPKDEAVASFVALVGRRLQAAFTNRVKSMKLTKQAIASELGVNRSQIHRWLSGYSNLTLESVALLVWAMRGNPLFDIDLEQPDNTRNQPASNMAIISPSHFASSNSANTIILAGTMREMEMAQ